MTSAYEAAGRELHLVSRARPRIAPNVRAVILGANKPNDQNEPSCEAASGGVAFQDSKSEKSCTYLRNHVHRSSHSVSADDQMTAHDAYTAVLRSSTKVVLPEGPAFSGEERAEAEERMVSVESEIGPAAKSDYFTTSRARFVVMTMLAKRYLAAGAAGPAKVLDVGNAPGYLALSLHRSGIEVHGINVDAKYMDLYPSPEIGALFNVKNCDIEKESLPYTDGEFDAIIFTEVLEHICVKQPKEILAEFRRVLRPGGVILFSTPNVCNLSNVIALLNGVNIFWPVEMFFGSIDRHNREFTPGEVSDLFSSAGYRTEEFFGINDHANWRMGTEEDIYSFLGTMPDEHPLLRNTTVGVFRSQ